MAKDIFPILNSAAGETVRLTGAIVICSCLWAYVIHKLPEFKRKKAASGVDTPTSGGG
jgi:hypothetical protein